MLTKIIQLNSHLCSKAVVSLDRDSIQLIGDNTVGKTSLINSLNFLFVIDGNRMQFGGEYDFQKSIHHYFPDINQSYMVFEISKNGHYCILIKRDTQKNLEFYKIVSEFREEHFYSGKQQKLLTFKELLANFRAKEVEVERLPKNQDVFNLVYQRDRKKDAVVWLQDSVKTSGLSNNFSRIYSYMINPRLINSGTLKEALILADNREGEEVNFSQGNKQDLYRLQELSMQLKSIQEIQDEFKFFVERVKEYNAKSDKTSKLYFAFVSKFNHEILDIEKNIQSSEREIAKIDEQIRAEIEPREKGILMKLGGKKTTLENSRRELSAKEDQLNKINNFGTLDMLRQSLHNLEKDSAEIDFKLKQIQHYNYTQKDLERTVSELKAKRVEIRRQVENYDKLLIHHISDKDEVKSLLSTVLSGKLLQLTKDAIEKPVKKADKEFLEIYDGKIKLPKDLKSEKFMDVSALKKDLSGLDEQIKEKEEILKVVEKRESNEGKLNKNKAQIESIRDQMKQVEHKSDLEKQVTDLQKFVENLDEEIDKMEKVELKEIEKKKSKFSEDKNAFAERVRKLSSRTEKLQDWNEVLKSEEFSPVEHRTEQSIDEIYRQLRELVKEIKSLKPEKDNLFNDLKKKTLRIDADEQDFITAIEEEIATIEKKSGAIDSLLQSIANSFSNPAFQLLDKFAHFKAFIANFNQQLGKVRISNIEKIVIKVKESNKLVKELELISKLKHFTKDNLFSEELSDNLKILKQYLEMSKKVEFPELFEIRADVTMNGKTKEIDFSKQIESTGADKVIRLFIILSIIHRLAVNDKENKIPICIDEILTIDPNNTNQMLQFCKENNFIPIFVAPHFITSSIIDKTYMLMKQKDGKAMPVVYAERNAK